MVTMIRQKYHVKYTFRAIVLLSIALFVLVFTYCKSLGIQDILLLQCVAYSVFLITGIKYKQNFLISPYFLFVSFYMIYSCTFPFIIEFGNITYYGVQKATVENTALYGLRFLCVLILIFGLGIKTFIPKVTKENISLPPRNDNELIAISVFSVLLELYCFFFGGFYRFISANDLVRTNLKNYVDNYTVWVFVGYLNIYVFTYFLLYFPQISKVKKTLYMIPIIIYFIICLLTGSRKFILYVMVIILNCMIMKLFNAKRILFLGAMGVVISTYMRVVVMDQGFVGNFFMKFASMTGEFIFPYLSFPISVQRGISLDNFNYPTIFDSILYFIPRGIFPQKNYSIGYTFSYQIMNVGMGFASSPLLEAYINFGALGYIIEPTIIGILLYFTTKISEKDYMLFLFGIVFLIDLNRGEVSFYIRQLLIVCFAIKIFKVILKKTKLKIR